MENFSLLIEGTRKERRKEFSHGDQVKDGFLNYKIFYLYFYVFFICVIIFCPGKLQSWECKEFFHGTRSVS